MVNTLCGRAGRPIPTDVLQDTLSRMHRLAGRSRDARPGVSMRKSAGIAVDQDMANTCVASTDRIIGAITGTPYWSDENLERDARDHGFALSMVRAFEERGEKILGFLQGAFALAIIDTQSAEALIAVDRMGICHLYFSHDRNSGLLFATSARSIGACDENLRRLNKQAIFDYLYFHMVPSPGCVFENQHKIKPGEYVSYRNGTVTCRRYWSPSFEDSGKADRRDLEHELHRTLRVAVQRCTDNRETGSFLSGGIDSSTIAGLLSELQSPAKTFTIGFKEKGYDETGFARTTSLHFDTKQFEYIVSPADVVDVLPEIAAAYDEPFGNSSVVPTYFCARLAKENGIDTLLAGDGGDELFGGNVRYVMQQIFGLYDSVPKFIKSILLEPIAFRMPGASSFAPTRKLQSYIRQARLPMPDRLESYNYFSRTPADDILHPDFMAAIEPDAPLRYLRERYELADTNSLVNKMLALDWKFTLADNDLQKVNRMCQLAGMNVRYPFLDDDLVEFSTRVPPSMKINRFRLRHFFKRAMRNFLPDEVLGKSKHGFGLPFGIWMNSYQPLKELAYDCLTDIQSRDIVRSSYLDKLKQSHRSEHAHYYGEFIWVLMMLELWLKTNVDNTGGDARLS